MNDRNMFVFIKAAESGSFTQAAKECYCSSVSVMNQINTLEDEVGVTLFVRTNHGVQLTPAGRSFYDDIIDIQKMMKNAVRNAQQIEASGKKVIRIGTSILHPCRELIDIWERADTDHSEFQLILVPFNDDPVSLRSVLETQTGIDCFVAPTVPVYWQKKYNICPIRELPCRIGVPRRHPLSKKTFLTWEDIRGESIILIKQELSLMPGRIRNDILENHRDVGIVDADSVYNLDTFNYCDQMNCLIETLDIWKDVHPALVTLPMSWEHKTPYGIIYSGIPSTALQEFMEIIRNTVKREYNS